MSESNFRKYNVFNNKVFPWSIFEKLEKKIIKLRFVQLLYNSNNT